ncbi:MAG: cation transporter, partial [Casimicrobium sp.]
MLLANAPQNGQPIALPDSSIEVDGATKAREAEAPSLFAFDVYDMDCAACALLIENDLRKLPGVITARVHFATQRARVTFDTKRTSEERIAARIASLGHAVGSDTLDREKVAQRIRRRFQLQTGIAAFCAMQIMMFSVPRFLGGADIEPELGRLMDGSALALTLPVLMFCVDRFFRGARREWRLRRLGMDSAIAISVSLAFAGSLWHLWVASGLLYFDSIAMFVALLLAVRWVEWERREQSRELIAGKNTIPATNTYALLNRAVNQNNGTIDIDAILEGIHIFIRRYDAVPVDGI